MVRWLGTVMLAIHLTLFILHFIAQHSTPLPVTGPQGKGARHALVPPTSGRPETGKVVGRVLDI